MESVTCLTLPSLRETVFWAAHTSICVSAYGAVHLHFILRASRAQEVGGTSVGTPAMAGIMALINQKAGAAQGNPNAELYALAATQNYSNCGAESGSTSDGCSFNDIDTGTIAMALRSGISQLHGDSIQAIPSVFSPATARRTDSIWPSGLGSLNVANVVERVEIDDRATPAQPSR